mmetsp:Transcript_26995/g.46856  ORF Transcript_26995/g.46856 Transcript_26995/m.46856 type:complete len:451 (+) Transcript_26995:107-1459(+)
MALMAAGRPPVGRPPHSSELVPVGGAAALHRGHASRPYSSSSLLSSIDDALRSLDEAITAEEEQPDDGEEEQPASTLALLQQEPAPRARAASGASRSHCSERRPLPSTADCQVPRVDVDVESAAKWLFAALRSSFQARKAEAFSRLARSASWNRRARDIALTSSANSRRGQGGLPCQRLGTPAAPRSSQRDEQVLAFALAAGRVVRHHERHECVAALHRWRDAALLATLQESEEYEVVERPHTPGGVRRAVETIEQRQSNSGQLTAAEAENRWLRRAVHRERLLQRSLVQFAVRLHQVKSGAFSKLKQHAAAFQVRPRLPHARAASSHSTSVEYEGQTRVIGARWLVCLLLQAQLRASDVAWRQLTAHAEFAKGEQLLADAQYSMEARMRLREAVQNFGPSCQYGGGAQHNSRPADDWVCVTAEAPRLKSSPLELFRPGSACATIQERRL